MENSKTVKEKQVNSKTYKQLEQGLEIREKMIIKKERR